MVERDLAEVEVPGSNPGVRSISGVSSPHRQNQPRGRPGGMCRGMDHPCAAMSTEQRARRAVHRVRTQPKWKIQAPVTELAYVSALEAEFWEFDSPLGHQLFSLGVLSIW